jgi:hypothetical protein
MTSKVILITRDTILRNNDYSFQDDDKRIILITFLYGLVANTYENIRVKKISSGSITYDEMKEAYDEMKANTIYSGTELLYFIDEKSIFIPPPSFISSLETSILSTLNTNNVDIFYLANAMDNCNSTENVYGGGTTFPYIYYKTLSPKGLFATVALISSWLNILSEMSKRIEDKATARLTSLVNMKIVDASTSWPRIVVPNIFMTEIDSIDNFYLNPCRIEDSFNRNETRTESLSFYWFSLGIMLVILFLWFYFKVKV